MSARTTQKTLFVFAHQDDEAGVFFEIEQCILKGHKITCVYLTDGGKLADARNAESMRILKKLGCNPDQIYFLGRELGCQDGHGPNSLKAIYDWLLVKLRNEQINTVYCPAFEGGHQDHDAINIVLSAISRAFPNKIKFFQFSLYNGYQLPWIFFRVMHPLPENGPISSFMVPLKRRLAFSMFLLGYPSQWKTWIGLFPFFALKYLFVGVQEFQLVSERPLIERPHSGALLYEKREQYRWSEFEQLRDYFLAEVKLGGQK